MDKNKLVKLDTEQILSELHSSKDGLTSAEASKRLQQYGPNILKNEARRSTLKLLVKQVRSSLVYLLLIASGLSFALKNYNDGIVIAVILILNTGLGFYQELRSEKAVEKLQKLVSKEMLVCRDGKQTLISERLLVVGDVVIMREGDIVPADIKLLYVEDLTVNESQLTGESMPVVKTLSGTGSFAYAGSVIGRGEGKGVIYAVSSNTQLGKIAHLSGSTKRVTQFEKSLTAFSTFLVRVTFLTLFAIFILKLLLTHDTSHIGSYAIFIIALSIAVVPEAMPVVVTVTLSRGALNLAKKHVITKTLSAVEDLGNINVLCSDKTGTLTLNKQSVKKLVADNPKLFQQLAIASIESLDEKRKKFQSSFDKAFLNFVPSAIQKQVEHYKRIEELPFDPAARRRRVVYFDGKKYFLVEVGSVETLLSITKDSRSSKYLKIVKEDGAMGLRHLGIAYKEVPVAKDENFDILKHENNLKFVGFVALEDPLRPSVKHTVSLAEKLGIVIKILSGDSKEVTHYVASEVGLISKDQTVYTGDEIDKMSDGELSDVVQKNNAFARLNPEQKYRIIKLLKLHGNVVGYQGDGINDAPALKLADVAIAVNNATDVAQESADILLLRSDIGVIINGIGYGRQIFSNINKYIRFTFVSNWGNFFALTALYLMSVNALPILPVQVLLVSLLTDLPCITIATDNVDPKELLRPSKFNIHSLMFISIFLGSLTAVFEILYFNVIKSSSAGSAETGLYLFLTLTALVVIFSIRNKDYFWKAPKLSMPMKLSFALVTITTFILIYLPAARRVLSFTYLPWRLLIISVVMTLIYFVVIDTVKVWFYRTSVANNLER